MEAGYFGPRLKELRNAAGLTQPQLAERAGLSKATVADLEQSRYAPTWPTVLALCGALGVRCDAFTERPAEVAPAGRGRPPKPSEAQADRERGPETAAERKRNGVRDKRRSS